MQFSSSIDGLGFAYVLPKQILIRSIGFSIFSMIGFPLRSFEYGHVTMNCAIMNAKLSPSEPDHSVVVSLFRHGICFRIDMRRKTTLSSATHIRQCFPTSIGRTSSTASLALTPAASSSFEGPRTLCYSVRLEFSHDKDRIGVSDTWADSSANARIVF